MGEREAIAEIRSYLQERFPGRPIDEEWDRSRDVLVLRVSADEGDDRHLLVEVDSNLIESAAPGQLREHMDRWDVARQVREHFRVLVHSNGAEPLPWKQLAPRSDRLDEAIEETFPASDAPSPAIPGRSEPGR